MYSYHDVAGPPRKIPSVNIQVGADNYNFHLADIEYLELARVVLSVLGR